MGTRSTTAQSNGVQPGTMAQVGGMIGQAANAAQQAATRARAASGGAATPMPTISEFWKSQTPNAEAAIMNIPNFQMARQDRDYTRNIGTATAPNTQEVSPSGAAKPLTPGGGLTQRYYSGISEIFDKLERGGVSSDPGTVKATIKEWFSPANRQNNLGKTVFNDPAFLQVANQGAGGGGTLLENTVDAITNQYVNLKRQRDNQFNIQPGTRTFTEQAVVAPAPARNTRVRVRRR
jgi:hypothetical protein